MIFLSYWFVFFALSFFPIYYLARDSRLRLGVLAGVIPIVVLAVLTYACAVSRRPPLCELATVACVASLVFYKYILFAATSIAAGWPAAGDLISTTAESVLPAAPPLAISIFVFEFVHYLYDVRRGSPPIRNPLKFGLFAIFWPSLVSGPIKRYQQFLPSLMAGVASVRATDSVAGLTRIAGGVVKKIAADNLTSWIEYQSARFGDLTIAERWLFLACLALRIYLDFSGYSDIAIGFARMMGIHLPENFNWPYIARSIDEFWRRWHISLSSWIRDYIYIPLGGSRRGISRRIINGLIAFTICGLWHGAAWNFAVWGLYHGAGLAVNGNYVRVLGHPGRALAKLFARVPLLSLAVTLLFVSFGWLLFFYPLPVAARMFVSLFRTRY